MSNRSGSLYAAPTDADRRPVALGASSADGSTPYPVEINPLTGRVLVESISSSGATDNVNLTQVGSTNITLGQKVMASSLPIVIASDQSAIPVTDSMIPSLGQATMAASLPVTIASNQSTVSVNSSTATSTTFPSTVFAVGGNSSGSLVGISAFANPTDVATNTITTLTVLSYNQVYNGSNWSRMRMAATASNTTGTGLLGTGNLAFDGTNYQRQYVNNTAAIIAAGTTSTQSNKTFLTYNGNKLVVLVSITAGAGTVTIAISGVSSSSYTYPILTSTALTGVGVTALKVFPGDTSVTNLAANDIVPSTVSITATVVGSITYGVDYILGV